MEGRKGGGGGGGKEERVGFGWVLGLRSTLLVSLMGIESDGTEKVITLCPRYICFFFILGVSLWRRSRKLKGDRTEVGFDCGWERSFGKYCTVSTRPDSLDIRRSFRLHPMSVLRIYWTWFFCSSTILFLFFCIFFTYSIAYQLRIQFFSPLKSSLILTPNACVIFLSCIHVAVNIICRACFWVSFYFLNSRRIESVNSKKHQ